MIIRNFFMSKKGILLIILFFFYIMSIFPQQNPLFKNKNKKIKKTTEQTKHKNKILWKEFSVFMAKMNKKLNAQFKKLKENFNFFHLLLLIGISLAYGFFHAAGPGHGKSLIIAYFLGNKSKIKDGIKISFMIGIMHTSMGLLLAIIFSFILRGIKGMLRLKMQFYFGVLSGALIIIIGIFLLINHLLTKYKSENGLPVKNKKNIYGIAFAIGIVPCPMTLAIALFSFSMGYFVIGIIAIIGIAVGISLFLLLVSIITIKTIHFSFGKLIKDSRLKQNILGLLHYASSIFIIIIGILLIVSAYGLG